MKNLIWLAATVLAAAILAAAQTPGTRVLKDLEYARAGALPLQLDLFLPAGNGPFPLTVYIHGGGFARGDKGQMWYTLMSRQPERGYALASLNYRLSGQAPFPAAVYDVKAAIRWLRANAVKYNLDAGRIVVAGESAGGYLAAMLGTSGGVAELEDTGLGNPRESSRVQGVVDFFGPTDFFQMDPGIPKSCEKPLIHGVPGSPEALFVACHVIADCPAKVKAANPIVYVKKDAPPFLILHGAADCSVSPLESQLLDDALRAAGVKAALHLYPGLGHGDPRFLTPETEKRVNGFIDGILKP